MVYLCYVRVFGVIDRWLLFLVWGLAGGRQGNPICTDDFPV